MEGLRQLLQDLHAERRRIGFVALGVAWGTLSLSLLLGFGDASYRATSGTIDNFGVDLLRVNGGATTRPFDGLPSGRGIPLRVEDVELLERGVPEARAVTLEYSTGGGNQVVRGDRRTSVPLSGVAAAFGGMRAMVPQPGGRFLNRRDVEEHRRVAFLGHRLKQRLFGDEPALGEEVEIDGLPFRVVGVRIDKVEISSYNGDSRDKVWIPHTTFRDLRGWSGVSFLWVGLTEPEQRDAAFASIRSTLGAARRFDPADEDAIEIQDYIAMRDMIHGMLDGNRYLQAVIGFFGLLVALLGVSNVMFVLVEERTSEIGLRMALGARPGGIRRAHLAEGLLVTFLGGSFGLLGCAGLFQLMGAFPLGSEVQAYLGEPRLSLQLGLALVLLLGLAGSLAAWFPARRAASLDPVSALREE